MKRLAAADALASLGLDRRGALWRALGEDRQPRQLPLFDSMPWPMPWVDEPLAELPSLELQEEVRADYATGGLSLRAHPFEFQRARLETFGIVPASALATLPPDVWVKVGGLVLVRQRPSPARGITFVTLEDETGTANLIIRQDVWQRYYRAARTATALVAHGRLQRKDSIIHVLVARLEDLTRYLQGIPSGSRDFH
jgi:error-prone DNA polymerase